MERFDFLILLFVTSSQVFVTKTVNLTCCASCSGSECTQVQPINIRFQTLVSSQPGFDVVIVPSIPIYSGLDNVCWSFLPLTENTYTLFTSEAYCNGLNVTSVYQVAQTAPGVLAFGSTLCNFQGTIFGQLIINEEGCNVVLLYLCFFFGECDLEPTAKTPVVIGLSPTGSRPLSSLCVYKATDLIDRAGFSSQDFNLLPMKQPKLHVTKYPKIT